MTQQPVASLYGVKERTELRDKFDQHAEEIRLLGYTVVDSGYSDAELADFRARLDALQEQQTKAAGGVAALKAIGEANTVRLLLAEDDAFIKTAANANVMEVCTRLLGDYFILNQQNGIINPAGEAHHQTAYHRDLPYQHYVSSRPLSISALLALDPFRTDNGATWMMPASQHREPMPAASTIEKLEVQLTAPAGSYLMFDSMVYHRAGNNRSNAVRRAINHMYTIPLFKQQIDIPAACGERYRTHAQARLLGYDSAPPTSTAAFRAQRLAKQAQ